jgi:hypothetical protein
MRTHVIPFVLGLWLGRAGAKLGSLLIALGLGFALGLGSYYLGFKWTCETPRELELEKQQREVYLDCIKTNAEKIQENVRWCIISGKNDRDCWLARSKKLYCGKEP